MYDRLNDTNNSNDGRGIQHDQERQFKRKWSENPFTKDTKINGIVREQNMKTTVADSAAPKLVKSTQLSGEFRRMHTLQTKRTLRKNVAIFEENTTHRKEDLIGKKDNWDYNKLQKIIGNKQKVFYKTTLLVNKMPIIFFIDSGSPVTLMPKCLFNDITDVEP